MLKYTNRMQSYNFFLTYKLCLKKKVTLCVRKLSFVCVLCTVMLQLTKFHDSPN